MDSANIHQIHEDQLVGSPSSSSSSLPTPSSYYGLPSSSSSTHNAWTPTTPNVTLNANNFNQSYNGVIVNPNSPMIQESAGLHWINSQSSGHHDHSAKEQCSFSFPKFTYMLNSPSSNIIDQDHSDLTTTSYLKNHDEQKNLNDLSDRLLRKTLSSSDFPISGNNNQFSAGDFYTSYYGSAAMPSRGNFSQIYPSINISNLNQSSSVTSCNFDMNLQALDLLTPARFSRGDFSQPSHDNNNLGLYKESLPFGFDHLHQSTRRPSCSASNNKISRITNNSGITEATKRPSGLMQPKATQSASNKKTRLESSRPSSPPFKVRKEKLGDRIAALQQLVAPFGKTDTASVLMEAIGYIKFLQNQVETLSVPYMKSSSRNNNSTRTIIQRSATVENGEEPKRDLRSRGLCLVPLSCMSYVTNVDAGCGGGGIWPPPNFGGGGT